MAWLMAGQREALTALVDRYLERDDMAGAVRALASALGEQSEDVASTRALAVMILVAVIGLIGTIVVVAT